MIKLINPKSIIITALTMVACQTTATANPVPAALTAMDETSMAALKSSIAKAMNIQYVTLGTQDLTNSSTITAIPTRHTPPPGAPQNHYGNFVIPTTFDLMVSDTGCYLVKRGTDTIIPLNGVSCRRLEVR